MERLSQRDMDAITAEIKRHKTSPDDSIDEEELLATLNHRAIALKKARKKAWRLSPVDVVNHFGPKAISTTFLKAWLRFADDLQPIVTWEEAKTQIQQEMGRNKLVICQPSTLEYVCDSIRDDEKTVHVAVPPIATDDGAQQTMPGATSSDLPNFKTLLPKLSSKNSIALEDPQPGAEKDDPARNVQNPTRATRATSGRRSQAADPKTPLKTNAGLLPTEDSRKPGVRAWTASQLLARMESTPPTAVGSTGSPFRPRTAITNQGSPSSASQSNKEKSDMLSSPTHRQNDHVDHVSKPHLRHGNTLNGVAEEDSGSEAITGDGEPVIMSPVLAAQLGDTNPSTTIDVRGMLVQSISKELLTDTRLAGPLEQETELIEESATCTTSVEESFIENEETTHAAGEDEVLNVQDPLLRPLLKRKGSGLAGDTEKKPKQSTPQSLEPYLSSPTFSENPQSSETSFSSTSQPIVSERCDEDSRRGFVRSHSDEDTAKTSDISGKDEQKEQNTEEPAHHQVEISIQAQLTSTACLDSKTISAVLQRLLPPSTVLCEYADIPENVNEWKPKVPHRFDEVTRYAAVINRSGHWFVVYLDLKRPELYVFNSLSDVSSKASETIANRWASAFMEPLAGKPTRTATSCEMLPKQKDNSSCGVFALLYLLHAAVLDGEVTSRFTIPEVDPLRWRDLFNLLFRDDDHQGVEEKIRLATDKAADLSEEDRSVSRSQTLEGLLACANQATALAAGLAASAEDCIDQAKEETNRKPRYDIANAALVAADLGSTLFHTLKEALSNAEQSEPARREQVRVKLHRAQDVYDSATRFLDDCRHVAREADRMLTDERRQAKRKQREDTMKEREETQERLREVLLRR